MPQDKYTILEELMNSTTNQFSINTFWECMCEMPDDLFPLIDDVENHNESLREFLARLPWRFDNDQDRFSCMQLALYYIQHATFVRTKSMETQIEVEENAKAIFQGHFGWVN